MYDTAKQDGGVDGSTREGAAVFPSCSPGTARPCAGTYPTTREADSGRGTLKKQTLKKSIVSCQISFLSWLPRAQDKQRAGPTERPGDLLPLLLLPQPLKEPKQVPRHPQAVGSPQVRKKCTANRETLSPVGG